MFKWIFGNASSARPSDAATMLILSMSRNIRPALSEHEIDARVDRAIREARGNEAKVAQSLAEQGVTTPVRFRAFSPIPASLWAGEWRFLLAEVLDMLPYTSSTYLPADDTTSFLMKVPVHPGEDHADFLEPSLSMLRDVKQRLFEAARSGHSDVFEAARAEAQRDLFMLDKYIVITFQQSYDDAKNPLAAQLAQVAVNG